MLWVVMRLLSKKLKNSAREGLGRLYYLFPWLKSKFLDFLIHSTGLLGAASLKEIQKTQIF